MPEVRQTAGVSRRVRRRRTVIVAVVLVVIAATALIAGSLSGRAQSSPATSVVPSASNPPAPSADARPVPSESPDPAVVPTFDRGAHSLDDPASIWVVVNKERPLDPVDFVPPDLVTVPVPYVWKPKMRQEASDAIVAMFAAFTDETGLELASQSAYRSYNSQVDVYNQDVQANGQAAADTSTARPGTSEHQTGLTMDISALPRNCSLHACFADTPHGQWLAANAWRFGFLLRYPADKTDVTGYEFEPWHFRYIGVDLATEMHETGVSTLEEFFDLPAAPDYD